MSLTGCAAYQPFTTADGIRARLVTWETVDDADKYCRSRMSDKYPPYPIVEIQGCVEYNNRRCTIYTSKKTNLHILGHELRHCFDGDFHE